MANEHWYVLKVRSGFASVVADKLRNMNLEVLVIDEVIIPDQSSIDPQENVGLREYPSTGYVYCRFALEDRLTITAVPGVLDVLGIPEPTPLDGGSAPQESHRYS